MVQRTQGAHDGHCQGAAAAASFTPEGVSMAHLLGFTGDGAVAVVGLALDTGAIARVFEVPVDGSGSVVEIGQLPAVGDNWVGPQTLEVASAALVGGSKTFEEPRWAWSHLAKLVSSFVLALFALGMYVTRRPRHRQGR